MNKYAKHILISLGVLIALGLIALLVRNYYSRGQDENKFLATVSCIIRGSTPIAFIYAFGGDELMKQHWTSAILFILLAAALIFLVIFIFKDRKKIIERTKSANLFTKK